MKSTTPQTQFRSARDVRKLKSDKLLHRIDLYNGNRAEMKVKQ